MIAIAVRGGYFVDEDSEEGYQGTDDSDCGFCDAPDWNVRVCL
jgi:hypothetical protein